MMEMAMGMTRAEREQWIKLGATDYVIQQNSLAATLRGELLTL